MQQKISEYTFLTLISTAFFFIWGILFSGHINAWYWANFFTTDISFFNYFLKERDLLQYIASFLVLFFKWNWIGAFILTSSVICIYLLTRRLLRKLTFSSNTNIISIIPCITLFALQIHRAFPFRKTLFIVCFLLFLLIFIWFYSINSYLIKKWTYVHIFTFISYFIQDNLLIFYYDLDDVIFLKLLLQFV